MKKNKLLHAVLGGLIATGLVASSFAILAQPDGGDRYKPNASVEKKQGNGFFLAKALKRLDLSPDQQTKVQGVLDANKDTAQKLHRQMRTDFRQIKDLVLSDKDNRAEIGSLAKSQGDLMAQMILQDTKVAKEVLHVLTADQVGQLRHMKAPLTPPARS